MSKKYLDNSGLSYFWGKINTKLNNKVDSTVEMTDQYNHNHIGTIENNGNSIKIKSDTDYTITDTYLECTDGSVNMMCTNASYTGAIVAMHTEQMLMCQYEHDNTYDYCQVSSGYTGANIIYYKNGALKGSISIGSSGTSITGVITPTSNDMAANKAYVDSAVSGKQDTLVSGTNIKTINNETILGNGNIDVDNIVDLSSYSAGDTISNSTIVAKLKKDNIIIIKGDSRYRMVNYSDSMYLYTVMNKVDGGDYIILSESGNNLFVAIMDSTYWQLKIDNNNKLSADLISDGTTNKTVTSSEKSTWNSKQNALVSGTNIKTINNTSLLGSGNISTPTDVEINGTSILSNNVANIVTNTAYNSSSNKIATMNDLANKVASSTITNIVTCTTAEYNASSKDSNTIYLLTD